MGPAASASAAGIRRAAAPASSGGPGTVNSWASSLPNGIVRSNPALAPARAPCSDGSSGTARKPDATTRSRSAWKRVASAQSSSASEKTSISASATKTCFTSALEPNTAAIALRASPGTRWRSETRALYIPPQEAVTQTATGSRKAVSSAFHSEISVFSAQIWAVSVRSIWRPPMVTVWNSASPRRAIASRWNTGLDLSTP